MDILNKDVPEEELLTNLVQGGKKTAGGLSQAIQDAIPTGMNGSLNRTKIVNDLKDVYISKPEWEIFWKPTRDWLRKLQNEGKLDASVIIPD